MCFLKNYLLVGKEGTKEKKGKKKKESPSPAFTPTPFLKGKLCVSTNFTY